MTFQYVDWTADKRQVQRHDGQIYRVSPQFLLWDNEYYYLVAYDEKEKGIRHYRVDKIQNATETELEQSSTEYGSQVKKAAYSRKRFGMFAGDAKVVSMQAPESYAGIMIDRFGTEVFMRKEGENIVVRAEVEVSPQFFGWLTGLGKNVVLTGPEEVVQQYREHLSDIMENYKD
jgi:predicted DNA-binding transcriptional regulator YafY